MQPQRVPNLDRLRRSVMSLQEADEAVSYIERLEADADEFRRLLGDAQGSGNALALHLFGYIKRNPEDLGAKAAMAAWDRLNDRLHKLRQEYRL